MAAHPAPDLRGITVLLPNFHAAQPLAQALMRAAQRPALLLPQMVTLNEWAQSVPLDDVVVTDSQRSALLYQHLRKQQWFENADLWSMTQELLKLFDELTHSLHELPVDADAFAAAVQQAYQARQNATLQLEARLVFELWHAMQAGDGAGYGTCLPATPGQTGRAGGQAAVCAAHLGLGCAGAAFPR